MAQEPNTQNPRKRGHSLAVYAVGLLTATAVILTIAVVIGAHRINHTVSLGTPVPDEGRSHVTDFSSFTNQHYPPSSGPHYRDGLRPGFYTTPVPEGSYVHNLEHGYIVVLFKRSAAAGDLAAQLQNLPDHFPQSKYGSVKLIIAPYDDMDTPVIVLAWDRELPLTTVDQGLLLRFYQQYVDHGPEDAP